MAMTAKERLRQRAAGLKLGYSVDANLPTGKTQVTGDIDPRFTLSGVQKQQQIVQTLPRQEERPAVQLPMITANDNRRFQTVAERAQNKPASTNPRARGGAEEDPVSKLGKALQSIGLSLPSSVEYVAESGKQTLQNTRAYLQSDMDEDYAAAVSELNRIRKYADESSAEYQTALANVNRLREQIDAQWDKPVDRNSRAAKFMGGVQQLQQEALEGTEGAGRFLGQTAISMGSNLAKLPLGLINPALPAVAMGVEATAGKAYELGQQGVGAGEALGRGVTSGVIEGVTEKMGIDNLFDLIKTGGKTALKNMLKQAGVEASEESLSYLMNWIADKAAQDPNAKFSLKELGESAASGALSGLVFGAGGTAVNRGNVNDRYGAPDVIVQTGKEKNVPTETSLHLADGQVRGLPMVEKTVETVQELPRVEQTSGQTATEPKGLPMVEKENTAGQSQTEEIQWDMIPYEDVSQQTQRMQAKHAEMIDNGSVVEIPESEINRIAEYYPDLRSVKKSERNIALKEKIKALKADLTKYLKSLTKEKFDFTVKNNVIEARVYDAGVREVRKALTQEKASMLSGSREIFKNAQYLYSTPDYEGNRQIVRWNYFYTPVKMGNDVVGVRIAIRDMKSDNTHQIYNWNIKKSALAGGGLVKDQLPPSGSSADFNSIVQQTEPDVKPSGLPMMRQESLQDALQASVTGGRTLGDNERKTGLPLPSTVESQLQALQELTADMDEDTSSVANIIRKYVGEDAANYWLEHGNETQTEEDNLSGRPTPEHSGAVTDEEGNVIGTEATAKLGVKVEGGIADLTKVQKAREAQWGLDVTNRQIAQVEKDLRASAAEKRMAENVAKGIDTLDSYQYGWDGKDNRRRSVVEELSALYRLRDTYDRNAVKALGRKNKDVFINTLNAEILNHLEQATPPSAVSLHTNTWDRNNLRTWGKTIGERLNRLIFDPIKENEASRIRWLNGQIDEMKILGDLTDAENEAVFDMLDQGKQTATYDGVRNDVVQKAAEQLRQKYSDYYDAINDVLVAHGYPEIGFIKNYAPHTNDKSMREAMSIFERLGLADTVTELPTEIAGRTDVFKPGKKWNPHFLRRTGEKTALDAVGGFASYVNYMSEVLHHVDDIQKVRTFGDQIRYLYGDEGLKADYDAIRADTTMNEQEKEQELEKLRERQKDNSKMGAYVTALDNYANILAGKQTQLDRAVETAIGRRGLNWLQKPIQMLVRSSIPGNLSSAVNQTVQLPWLTAEAGEGNVLQAAYDLTRGKLRKENFGAESRFITGKRGAQGLDKLKKETIGEQLLDAASTPFEVVDDAVSQVIVRAFYLKNIKGGMDHKQAMRKADQQAEQLVGSRMKGAKANVFSDKSLKMLTTFQLEVANQWQHLKFDLPQEFREIEQKQGTNAAVSEAAKRILKGTLYTVLLNDLIEQITGNRPAGYDIIGAIRDYIRAGQPEEDDEEQKFDATAGLGDLAQTMADDVPFAGNIGAVLGVGDGRLPLPTVDYETIGAGAKKLINAETEEEKKAAWKRIGSGAAKSAATMLPMGNQIKKTIQGATDVSRGGRYSSDGTQLLYEVEQTPANKLRGSLFGRNALPETREYWDEGGKAVLSQKQTALMKQAEQYGVDQSTYIDFIQQAKKLQGDKDAEGNTIDGSLERKKIALLNSMDLSGEQKLQLYLDNVASDSRKEDVDAMAAAGMSWNEMAPAIETYLSLKAGEGSANRKATEMAAWADQNLKHDQAEVVKELLEYWQMMPAEASAYEKLATAGLSSQSAQTVYNLYQSLEPEAGKSTVTETQKQAAIADSRDLTEKEKQLAVRSMLEDKALEKFDRCTQARINTKTYVDVKTFYSNTTADKNENGKSITGSKKEKVWKYINNLKVTPAQKDALSILCEYDTKLEEAPWNKTGIQGLPMIEQEEKPVFALPVF